MSVCKYCTEDGLTWSLGNTGWRLRENDGSLHTCDARKKAMDRNHGLSHEQIEHLAHVCFVTLTNYNSTLAKNLREHVNAVVNNMPVSELNHILRPDGDFSNLAVMHGSSNLKANYLRDLVRIIDKSRTFCVDGTQLHVGGQNANLWFIILRHLAASCIEYYMSENAEAELRQYRKKHPNTTQVTALPETIYFPQPEDTTVATIKIENKTFVNGVDAKSFTDQQLFDTIAAAEAEIKKLESLEARPKKIEARITELRKGIDDLVALSDADATQ